jgi:predicted Zn-dependent protease with MMP-like domain
MRFALLAVAASGWLVVMIEVSRERFEELVADALDGIPARLAEEMSNVAVFVEDVAPRRNLLGLYVGIPLTKRTSSYTGTLPDRIMIYRSTICRICSTEAEVVEQVRKTVVHEVAHHFGISDERLDQLGY